MFAVLSLVSPTLIVWERQ